MADCVLIPLPGLGTLALERAAFTAALAAGAALCAAPASQDAVSQEPLIEAKELAKLLNVKLTWVEQAARDKRIPSYAVGRWPRFRRSEVEAVLAVRSSSGGAPA